MQRSDITPYKSVLGGNFMKLMFHKVSLDTNFKGEFFKIAIHWNVPGVVLQSSPKMDQYVCNNALERGQLCKTPKNLF